MANHKRFDVKTIGVSYSGLSAAMALGRSLRNVLIIDGSAPCNIQTPYSHAVTLLDVVFGFLNSPYGFVPSRRFVNHEPSI